MSGARALALLPLRQSPLVTGTVALLVLAGIALGFLAPRHNMTMAFMMLGFALWFVWLLAGSTLKGLARKETLLLPGFHAALAQAAGAWAVLFWLAPGVAVALHYGPRTGATTLGVGALAIAWALMSGSGSRNSLWVWVPIILARYLPRPLLEAFEPVLYSAWMPVLALLLSALVMRATLRRLFPAGDPPLPDTPLMAPDPSRRGGMPSTAPRGKLLRGLNTWSEQAASVRLQRMAAHYHQRPGPARERAMLRALLLPHEQPRGWLVRWLLWGGFIAFYALALGHGAQIGMIAGYATFFAMTGLNVVGAGMPRVQPSLVELYFTLAPQTRAGFKAQLVDSFLGLLPGAILSAFVYTGIAAALIAPHALPAILGTTAVLAPPLALATLALYLLLPANMILRTVVTVVTVFVQMGSYWLGYAVLRHFGPLWGGGAVLVVAWAFAAGTWSGARAHWIGSALSFDPPKAKAGA